MALRVFPRSPFGIGVEISAASAVAKNDVAYTGHSPDTEPPFPSSDPS